MRDLQVGEGQRDPFRRRKVVWILGRSRREGTSTDADLKPRIFGPLGNEEPFGVRRRPAGIAMEEQDQGCGQGALAAVPDPMATETASRIDLKHGGAAMAPAEYKV